MNNYLSNTVSRFISAIKQEVNVSDDEAQHVAALFIQVCLYSKRGGWQVDSKMVRLTINAIRNEPEVYNQLNQMPLEETLK